jgi:hypothetical protein
MKITRLLTVVSAVFLANSLMAQNVGIGTAIPTEKIHVVGGARITSLSGVGNRLVQSNATGVLSNIAAGGNGSVLTTVGGVPVWQDLQADNGLYYSTGVDRIRLGGALVEPTTITQGVNQMTFSLDGTGDFNIQDAGITHFQVQDNGLTYFGDDTYWNDGSVTGTTIARLYDSGDDGVFQVYSNGALQHNINSIGATVFNEQGTSVDFRIESNLRANMFFVDGGTDRIGINTGAPASPLQYISAGENLWLMQWDNNSGVGAAARFQNTSAANGNRTIMGLTNYSGSAFTASAVIGLSLNTTTTGSGGIGVTGSANNESGTAVEGNLFFAGGYTGWAGYFNADVFCGGTYFGSDRRLKRDINPVKNALDLIDQIAPVSYYYDTEKYPQMGLEEKLTYGFIAQELELVFPEMVKNKALVVNSNTEKTGNMESDARVTEEFKVVNYTLMIPILTQGMKEQQVIIEDQNTRIELLEQELEEIKSMLLEN